MFPTAGSSNLEIFELRFYSWAWWHMPLIHLPNAVTSAVPHVMVTPNHKSILLLLYNCNLLLLGIVL